MSIDNANKANIKYCQHEQKNIDPINTVIVSPCVSNCCLNEQDICLGCYRHITEITGWRQLDAQDKQNVLRRCQQRKQS